MGPAEELVRIAKKLDKMVARKSTVRRAGARVQYLHTRARFAHSCQICAREQYLHACNICLRVPHSHYLGVLAFLGSSGQGEGGKPRSSPTWQGEKGGSEMSPPRRG